MASPRPTARWLGRLEAQRRVARFATRTGKIASPSSFLAIALLALTARLLAMAEVSNEKLFCSISNVSLRSLLSWGHLRHRFRYLFFRIECWFIYCWLPWVQAAR